MILPGTASGTARGCEAPPQAEPESGGAREAGMAPRPEGEDH